LGIDLLFERSLGMFLMIRPDGTILLLPGGAFVVAPVEGNNAVVPNPESPDLPLLDDEGNVIVYEE
jgi:hypothetical protein